MEFDKLGPLQEKWLQALESGEYKQCKGYLCIADENENKSYCCLGVACVVAGMQPELKPEKFMPHTGITHVGLFDRSTFVLPDYVQSKLAFRTKEGAFDTKDVPFDNVHTGTLMSKNDHNATFKEIAEFVRKNPSLIFEKPV